MTSITDDDLEVQSAGEPVEHIPARIGRYRVVGMLGEGGMGTVLEAFDPDLDRKVAIKLLRRTLDERRTTRLRREAQAMAKLSHPHVVQVYEVGEVEGQTFVAMELVEGPTVRDWMRRSPRPSWRECVEVFVQLGDGLAAAHDRGLVHRDFKPGNAMLDREGRARVLDFGLACRAESDPRDDRFDPVVALDPPDGMDGRALDTPSALDTPLTRTGAMLGTPAYMSLEQMYGREADTRSDQFSFCVSMYEALYGERPYKGGSIGELGSAMLSQTLPAEPSDTSVPRALRRILARGLAARPQDRWPSMDELLAELRRRLAPRRRWWLATLAGIGLGGLGMSLASIGSDEPPASPDDPRCTGATAELQGAWDPERRDQVRTAILGTLRPHAAVTWERVEARLDAYGQAWAEGFTGACEATALRHEQSEPVMELRMSCLRRDRAALRSTVDVLAAADAKVVDRAIELVARLPDPTRCDDVERLLAKRERIPPPDDPVVAREVEALRERLEDVAARDDAGAFDDALRMLGPVMEQVDALGYAPLRAEAKYRRGVIHNGLAQYEPAERDLREAYALAVASGLEEVEFGAALKLTYVVGTRGERHVEGLQWGQTARPLAQHLGDPSREAMSVGAVATVLEHQGRYPEAEAEYRQALEVLEASGDSDELRMATMVNNLGTVLMRQGKLEAAEAMLRRALELKTSALGPDHPRVASGMSNLASVLGMQGKLDEVAVLLSGALSIQERTLGPEHPLVASIVSNLGLLSLSRGDAAQAKTMFERALRIRQAALGPDHPKVGETAYNLGELLASRGEVEAARVELERALRITQTSLGDRHPTLINPLVGLAAVTLEADPSAARVYATRALTIAEQTAVAPDQRARAQWSMVQALWSEPAQRKRARTLANNARDGFAAAGEGYAEQRVQVEAWLAEHLR